jgi:predicted dehydrogenase
MTMLNWAILGTSFISNTVAEALRESKGSRIASAFGRDPQRLAAFAQTYGIEKTSTKLDAILDDPAIDVVYVGLPNHIHAEAVCAAAARGKAILSEKSLTRTVEEAEALIAAVDNADIFFLEGLMYLAHPLMARVGNIIASGRLGRLCSVSGHYAAAIAPFANPLGGGTIFNLGCYPASLLHYVTEAGFGGDAFRRFQCVATGNISASDGTVCDASLAVRFDNGLIATLQSTDSIGMDHAFTVLGEKGSLRFITNPWLPVAGDNVIEVTDYGNMPERVIVTSDRDAFGHQVELVEKCLSQGLKSAPRPSPSPAHSLEIMRLLSEWERQIRANTREHEG